MDAKTIEDELTAQGLETNGVVVWDRFEQYYAVGFRKSELPSVNGYRPKDDPSLSDTDRESTT